MVYRVPDNLSENIANNPKIVFKYLHVSLYVIIVITELI